MIENGQFQRGAGFGIQLADVCFFGKFFATKGGRKIQVPPLCGIQKGCRFIYLGRQIQGNDFVFRKDNGIDLHVDKIEHAIDLE